MREAVYGASLDLMTNGHLWVIATAAKLFDRVTVAVSDNPSKKYMFQWVDRLHIAREVCVQFPNVRVEKLGEEFLADYAERNGAGHLVRGVRNVGDFEYERLMQSVNREICPDITTVFLVPPDALAKISSSMVKGLIGLRGWRNVVRPYVPQVVYEALDTQFP